MAVTQPFLEKTPLLCQLPSQDTPNFTNPSWNAGFKLWAFSAALVIVSTATTFTVLSNTLLCKVYGVYPFNLSKFAMDILKSIDFMEISIQRGSQSDGIPSSVDTDAQAVRII